MWHDSCPGIQVNYSPNWSTLAGGAGPGEFRQPERLAVVPEAQGDEARGYRSYAGKGPGRRSAEINEDRIESLRCKRGQGRRLPLARLVRVSLELCGGA